MARLKLKSGNTYAEVGKLLIDMADPGAQPRLESLRKEFEGLFDDTFVKDGSLGRADDVELVFHHDRTEKGGARVVNVVIPDLAAKLASHRPKPGTIDDIAAEAFGFVTIMGCAG